MPRFLRLFRLIRTHVHVCRKPALRRSALPLFHGFPCQSALFENTQGTVDLLGPSIPSQDVANLGSAQSKTQAAHFSEHLIRRRTAECIAKDELRSSFSVIPDRR